MAIVSRLTESAPWFDERHGPLPALLLVHTVVTGLVDAVSYLKLGHVFVANMTGNVVFPGLCRCRRTGLLDLCVAGRNRRVPSRRAGRRSTRLESGASSGSAAGNGRLHQ